MENISTRGLPGLKLFRSRTGVKQCEFAEAVGVHRKTIEAVELGRCDPSLSLLRRISAHIGCTLDDLANTPSRDRLEEIYQGWLRAELARAEAN